MTNKATRDKIKQACRLYPEFEVHGSRLICKICNTTISMTSKTKLIELVEHFKTIKHLKCEKSDDSTVKDPQESSQCNETISSSGANDSNDSVESGGDSDSNSVTTVSPMEVTPGPSSKPNSESIKRELDDDIQCEFESLKSFARPIKTEFDSKAAVELHPSNQQFYNDLIELCLNVNISITKLTGPESCSFFLKHFSKTIPSMEKIRQHVLKPMYESKMCKLKELVSNHNIYLIVKQHWCEARGHVVTLMVGVLDGKPARSYLYKISVMKHVDLTILSQEIIAILHNLYQGLAFDKLSLLVTDDCPLSMSIGSFLKTLFPKLRHVTCLIIMLDSWCESFRLEHKLLSEYVSIVNSIFSLSPKFLAEFKQRASKPIEFPLGSSNLFGAKWMEAVESFCYEFHLISEISKEAMSNSSIDLSIKEKIEKLTILADNKDLQMEIIDYTGYRSTNETIKLLSTNIYNVVQIKKIIDGLGRHPKRSVLINRIKATLSSNPDLETILSSNFSPGDENSVDNIFFHAPLCVTDSFKCFQSFKSMLEEDGGTMQDSDLELMTFLSYNKDL